MEIKSDHPDFKFVKELPSNTKVRAVHFKIAKESYHVCVADMGRMGWFVSGYEANKNGRPKDVQKYFFSVPASFSNSQRKATLEDLQIGVTTLIDIINQ